jgi:hypothetical protein
MNEGLGVFNLFNALDPIFSMGRIGLGIANTLGNYGNIARAKGFYESQVAINQEVASFNSAVAWRAGNVAMGNIAWQTHHMVGDVKNKAAKRGVEFEGSSSMFVDAVTTMGMHALFEAAYDSEVKMTNLDLQREAQNRQAAASLENFDLMRRQNTSNLMDQMFGIGNLLMTNVSNDLLRRKGSEGSRSIERTL